MNADLLAELLQATVAISLAMTLVLLLRRPLRAWLGARAAYFIWLLAPLAVVAVLLPAPVRGSRIVTAAGAVIGIPEQVSVAMAPVDGSMLPLLLVVGWLLGGIVALLLFARRQARFNRLVVRRAQHPFDEVSGHGPAVSGLFKPRIVLPADFHERYSKDEQALIIAHEQAHVRRGDIQAQALAVGLRCVFWFNPLMHIAAARFRFDQELACDATVLSNFPAARRTYGDAMLKTQLAELGLPVGCTWQSGHSLKERITMLKSTMPSTPRRLLAQAGLVLACLLAACAVWAAQTPAPTTTATQEQTFDSRFTINVDGVASGSPRMLSKAGESLAFSVGEAPGKWDVTLEYHLVNAKKIEVAGVIRHDGVVVSRPRLVIHPDVESGVGVSTPDGKSLLEFKFVVSDVTGKMPKTDKDSAQIPTVTKVTAQDVLTTPVYPDDALAKGISGKVMLKVLVGADGMVKDVSVESAQPADVFNAAAIKAAYSWKFTPGSRQSDGKKVEGWVRVPVQFDADKSATKS